MQLATYLLTYPSQPLGLLLSLILTQSSVSRITALPSHPFSSSVSARLDPTSSDSHPPTVSCPVLSWPPSLVHAPRILRSCTTRVPAHRPVQYRDARPHTASARRAYVARFRPALAPTPAPASVLLRTPPLTLVAIVERKGQRIADTGMGIEPHAEHHVGGSGKQRQPLLAKSVTPLFLVR